MLAEQQDGKSSLKAISEKLQFMASNSRKLAE
jgi:hypothetical protein